MVWFCTSRSEGCGAKIGWEWYLVRGRVRVRGRLRVRVGCGLGAGCGLGLLQG